MGHSADIGMMRYLMVFVSVCTVPAFPPDNCQATGSAQSIAAGHDMSGKTVFMTGGDTGIAYEFALVLAGQNASIVMANHNAAKGQSAAAKIAQLTGNLKVEALQVDLESFESVRVLVASLLAKHPVIDVVLCDAGVRSSGRPLTEDGFEPVMQVNYIGHFLLEQLLLPALRAAGKGKLLHISSGNSYEACKTAGLPNNCIDDATVLQKLVKMQTSNNASNYGISKLMQIFNARELAVRESARGSGVRAYSIFPGLVSTPSESRVVTPAFLKYLCSYPVCAAGLTKDGTCQTPCPMPVEAGACTPTYIAVTDLPQSQDGSLFSQCEVKTEPAWGSPAQQKKNQKDLYDMSLKWTGIVDTNLVM